LIRKRSQQFISYYGEGDPYVSKSHFEGLAKQLQAQKIIISQGGHFNVDSGYTQFPQLLLHLETRFYKGKNDA
ncbi:MAG TPA: alpha/beta hydrolase, partial [Gammaproteobacteria bacterium]|nr:alpha/beta hydrolase [Gammaproteobacteria bacterium]